MCIVNSVNCIARVRTEVSNFIVCGHDVFAKHVDLVSDEIRSKDEVIVVDNDGKVLAVGWAVLPYHEMKSFKKGIAVKVRHGASEEG